MSKKEEIITFQSVLIAEDLRQEISGLQSIIGVFPRRIESPAPTLQLAKIIFRIEFDSDEDFSGNISFTLTGPGDTQIFANPSPVQMSIKKSLTNICAFGWGPVVFSQPGIYRLRFSINDRHTSITPFKVVLAGNDGTNQPLGGSPST